MFHQLLILTISVSMIPSITSFPMEDSQELCPMLHLTLKENEYEIALAPGFDLSVESGGKVTLPPGSRVKQYEEVNTGNCVRNASRKPHERDPECVTFKENIIDDDCGILVLVSDGRNKTFHLTTSYQSLDVSGFIICKTFITCF